MPFHCSIAMYIFISLKQSKQRLLIGLGSMGIGMYVCDTPWENLMFDGGGEGGECYIFGFAITSLWPDCTVC